MIQESAKSKTPVAFLDCQNISLSLMSLDRQFVVSHLARAFSRYSRAMDYIMFAFNPGGHWVLVVMIPKWTKVLYLDPTPLSKQYDYGALKIIIDE